MNEIFFVFTFIFQTFSCQICERRQKCQRFTPHYLHYHWLFTSGKKCRFSFENNYDQLITLRVFSDSLNSCRLIYSQFPLLYTSSLIRVMLFTSQIMLISWGKTIFSSAIQEDSLLYWHWSFHYSTTWLTEGMMSRQEFASFYCLLLLLYFFVKD